MVAQNVSKQPGLVVGAVEDGVVLNFVRFSKRWACSFMTTVSASASLSRQAVTVIGSPWPSSDHSFLEELLVVGDDGVGGLQDAHRGAVVLLQLDDLEGPGIRRAASLRLAMSAPRQA